MLRSRSKVYLENMMMNSNVQVKLDKLSELAVECLDGSIRFETPNGMVTQFRG